VRTVSGLVSCFVRGSVYGVLPVDGLYHNVFGRHLNDCVFDLFSAGPVFNLSSENSLRALLIPLCLLLLKNSSRMVFNRRC